MEFLQSFYSWQWIGIGIVFLCFIYTIFLKNKLSSTLTSNQLTEIDAIIERGITYGKQMYEANNSINVKSITIEYILTEIRNSKIVPDVYMSFVETIVKTKLA